MTKKISVVESRIARLETENKDLDERLRTYRERLYHIEASMELWKDIFNKHQHNIEFQPAAFIKFPNEKM